MSGRTTTPRTATTTTPAKTTTAANTTTPANTTTTSPAQTTTAANTTTAVTTTTTPMTPETPTTTPKDATTTTPTITTSAVVDISPFFMTAVAGETMAADDAAYVKGIVDTYRQQKTTLRLLKELHQNCLMDIVDLQSDVNELEHLIQLERLNSSALTMARSIVTTNNEHNQIIGSMKKICLAVNDVAGEMETVKIQIPYMMIHPDVGKEYMKSWKETDGDGSGGGDAGTSGPAAGTTADPESKTKPDGDSKAEAGATAEGAAEGGVTEEADADATQGNAAEAGVAEGAATPAKDAAAAEAGAAEGAATPAKDAAAPAATPSLRIVRSEPRTLIRKSSHSSKSSFGDVQAGTSKAAKIGLSTDLKNKSFDQIQEDTSDSSDSSGCMSDMPQSKSPAMKDTTSGPSTQRGSQSVATKTNEDGKTCSCEKARCRHR